MPETITFELIRKIQFEEQNLSKLTKLPENFYNNVTAYLEQKKELAKSKDDRRVAVEVKNIERLIENVFNIRERKIINQTIITARTNIPPENLTEEEQVFFDQTLAVIKLRRREILNSMLEKTMKKAEAKRDEEVVVELVLARFKEDVPEFVGIDLKTYGPFKKDEEVEIPPENFELLANKNIVEKIER